MPQIAPASSSLNWRRREKHQDAAETASGSCTSTASRCIDAAHTLQGRLFNIVGKNFLGKFLRESRPTRRSACTPVTTRSTRIAEYLTWVEIVRREMRFLDLGDAKRNRDLMERLTGIQSRVPARRHPPTSSRSSAAGSGRSPR